MIGKQSKGSSWTSILGVACLFSSVTALSQDETATAVELAELDEAYVNASGTLTRCGKYFLLESKTFGELEVKQVHLFYGIGEGNVAMAAKYYRDLEVVIDDARTKPALLLKRENPGLEKDRIELSEASYEEAKACVPPPNGEAT